MPLLMHMANIKGDSEIEPGWMVVSQFEWSGKRSVAAQMGGAYGRSSSFAAPQISAVQIRRDADSASALLWQEMVSGVRAKLQFKWLRTGPGGGGPIAFFEATFEEAKVIEIHANSVSGTRPVETIKFIYESVQFRLVNIDDSLTGTQDVVSYDLPMHALG